MTATTTLDPQDAWAYSPEHGTSRRCPVGWRTATDKPYQWCTNTITRRWTLLRLNACRSCGMELERTC